MHIKTLSFVLLSLIGLSSATTLRDDPPPLTDESLRLVITQTFFDNLQQNLLSPLIQKLDGAMFADLIPISIDVDFMQLAANITNFGIQNCTIDDTIKFIELQENGIDITIPNLVLNLTFDYAYISEPPILADLGQTMILADKLFA